MKKNLKLNLDKYLIDYLRDGYNLRIIRDKLFEFYYKDNIKIFTTSDFELTSRLGEVNKKDSHYVIEFKYYIYEILNSIESNDARVNIIIKKYKNPKDRLIHVLTDPSFVI